MRGKGVERTAAVVVGAALAVLPALPATAATATADRTTPPAPLVTEDFATSRVHTRSGPATVLVSSDALPFGYYVDRRLAERFGIDQVVAAMGQWNGVAGSRWSAKYLGLVDAAAGQAAPDGTSVVFFDRECSSDHGGHAYRRMDTAVRDEAYGAVGLYVSEVDIGVCSSVEGVRGLWAVLAHEVGHALGLDHLCDPGTDCWQPGMGDGPHACRVMYHGRAHCWPTVTERDHEALRHLYPTLRRLSGPSREETAARASYAMLRERSARTVVIARSDQSGHGPLAAAALAAGMDAPLLLARPADSGCLAGSGLEELHRAARGFARVLLVGDWPASCRSALFWRTYSAERISAAGPVSLSVTVADYLSGAKRVGDAAVLVSSSADAAGHVPDGVAGGAAAGAAGGPVLYTVREELPGSVAGWLARNEQVRTVYVLGGERVIGEAVLDELRAAGIRPVRVAGPDRVTTALELASHSELFPADSPVVVAAAGAWPDAVTGSALGGRIGAPVVITGPAPDPRVQRWLGQRRPPRGFVVGGTAAVPHEVQRAYTRHIGTFAAPFEEP